MEADSSARKTILTMVVYYLPGHKAGGPIRSISNMVEAFGTEFDFLILTSDRDLRSPRPYEGISTEKWLPVGKAKVMYLSRKGLSVRNLWRLLKEIKYDLLYLNSFFARRFSLIPCFLKWLGMIPEIPIVLAPRGEFSEGAVNLKHWRKKLYIRLSIFLGVYKDIVFHASSEFEKKDITRDMGMNINVLLASPLANVYINEFYNRNNKDRILIAMDNPDSTLLLNNHEKNSKTTGSVRFCFLSRISPKKNLDMAIELLGGLEGDIQYHIYGPIEDKTYWNRCEKRIEAISANIAIEYKGEVPHELVGEVFSGYDFFLFPTRGENYGHVIMESLLAGCPVIISDQTPWRNLEANGVGWDLPLEDRDAFRNVLQKCIDMNAEEYVKHSTLAREYAESRSKDPEILEQNRSLFMKVLGV